MISETVVYMVHIIINQSYGNSKLLNFTHFQYVITLSSNLFIQCYQCTIYISYITTIQGYAGQFVSRMAKFTNICHVDWLDVELGFSLLL